MKPMLPLLLTFCLATTAFPAADTDGRWYVLFDGSSLEGWRSNAQIDGIFSVTDEGVLKVQGGPAHLFWMGRGDIPARFENFELSARVKTTPRANSGIFFHTEFQEKGWLAHGLEAQINSTHWNKNRTGSLYGIKNITGESPSEDGPWFDYRIKVTGKEVSIHVDGERVNHYTEPTPPRPPRNRPHAKLGEGLIAIQGHDPFSTVYFKDIRVRPLP